MNGILGVVTFNSGFRVAGLRVSFVNNVILVRTFAEETILALLYCKRFESLLF